MAREDCSSGFAANVRVGRSILIAAGCALLQISAPKALAQVEEPALSAAPGKGVTLSDQSGANSITVKGLFSHDVGFYDGGDPAIVDRGEVRDAIVNVTGKLAERLRFQFAYDFADREAPPETPFKNVTASYSFANLPLIITVGNQKVPFSQQHLNPVPQLVFAERALPFAIAPRRRLGMTAGYQGDRWQAMGGIFATNLNRNFDADDRSVAARATWAPKLGEDGTLHLGAAFEFVDPADGSIAFGFPPETLLPERPLVASGKLDGEARKLNLELGGRRGPLTIQSEWHLAEVEGPGPDPLFKGGYVQAAWLLTGESRPYIVANGPMLRGVFGRPKVADPVKFARPLSSGLGAVEIAARLSAVDLRDSGIGGGSQWSGTLGVNWFLNRSIRLTANYIHTQTDEANAPDETVDAFLLRTEVRF